MRSLLSRLAHRGRPAVPDPLATILSVEGQIDPGECALLFDLASQVSSGCIVEIGSYRGRSTVALALGSLRHGKVPVYAIDPHEPFRGVLGGEFSPRDRTEFFKNILSAGVAEIVHLVNLRSEVAAKGWDQEVSLLWVDGDHRYEAVRRDVECWEPFVVKNGVIGLHDSSDPDFGPYRVAREMARSGRCEMIRQVGSTTVLRKLG